MKVYLLQWRDVTNALYIWTAEDRNGNSMRPSDWPQTKSILKNKFNQITGYSLSYADFIPDRKFWPLRYRQEGRQTKMPDLSSVDEFMTLVVNSRTRNLIEALEPETHTFVPMKVELATGETVENEYWLFRNGNWVEGGIIPEKSEIGVDDVKDKPWAVNKTRPPRYYVRSLVPKLVWRKEKVAGKHMWMDPALPGDLAISAELAESFKANKIKHFELVEGEAV